jgi:hypothetical protein
LCRTAVSISIAFMPSEPSPCTTITCLSGHATFAPTPNGKPTPMVPNGPEFSRWPGENVGIVCRP